MRTTAVIAAGMTAAMRMASSPPPRDPERLMATTSCDSASGAAYFAGAGRG
jgi:hypothetical protein